MGINSSVNKIAEKIKSPSRFRSVRVFDFLNPSEKISQGRIYLGNKQLSGKHLVE